MIIAQPFDPSLMGAIEQAIRSSDLGLNPANDGKVVRIPIPALNEERRKELSRHVHKMTEEGRNHVRTVRRDANDRLKKMLKEQPDLRRRREAGARRRAEDHRRAHQGDRRAAAEEGQELLGSEGLRQESGISDLVSWRSISWDLRSSIIW